MKNYHYYYKGIKSAYAVALISLSSLPEPTLAVATNLRTAFNKGLGIIMMLAFMFGLIKVISGSVAISNGNPDGKSAIIGGMLVAGAASIMIVLFKIFGMSAGALDPDFSMP